MCKGTDIHIDKNCLLTNLFVHMYRSVFIWHENEPIGSYGSDEEATDDDEEMINTKEKTRKERMEKWNKYEDITVKAFLASVAKYETASEQLAKANKIKWRREEEAERKQGKNKSEGEGDMSDEEEEEQNSSFHPFLPSGISIVRVVTISTISRMLIFWFL